MTLDKIERDITDLKNNVTELKETLTFIKNLVKEAINNISNTADNAISEIKYLNTSVHESFNDAKQQLNEFKYMVGNDSNSIKKLSNETINNITDLGKEIFDNLSQLNLSLNSNFSNILQRLSDMQSNITNMRGIENNIMLLLSNAKIFNAQNRVTVSQKGVATELLRGTITPSPLAKKIVILGRCDVNVHNNEKGQANSHIVLYNNAGPLGLVSTSSVNNEANRSDIITTTVILTIDNLSSAAPVLYSMHGILDGDSHDGSDVTFRDREMILIELL